MDKTLIDIAEDLIAMSTNLVCAAAEIKTLKCNAEEDTCDRRDKLNAFDDVWHEHPALLRHAVESIKDKNVTPDEWFELLKDEENHHIWLEAHWATEGQKYEIYNSAKFYVNLLYDGE